MTALATVMFTYLFNGISRVKWTSMSPAYQFKNETISCLY